MKDAKCAETNEKPNFRFLFFELWSFLYSKHPNCLMNFYDKSKNRNLKIDFSFDSAYCASVMKVASKLREGERAGSAYP